MIITAKYASKCAFCQGPIAAGDKIEWERGKPSRHPNCIAGAVASTAAPAAPAHPARSSRRCSCVEDCCSDRCRCKSHCNCRGGNVFDC